MPGTARFTALTIAILALLLVTACGAEEDDATPTPGTGGAPTATESPGPTATAGQEQPALENTAWLLEGMNGVDLDLQTPITLAFSAGRASGNAGCNDYGGAYTVNPDGAFSIPDIEQTDMACEGGMELEAEYLGTLREVAHYDVIEDARLELSVSSGETILVFTVDERLPLDDTTWNVTELNGEALIGGSDVHFTLRAGELSGSGGCNQFGGQYSADADGAFSTSELFWTEMGCIEPEGLMEQEQSFFEALAEITTYRHASEKQALTLVDAEGETRIVATRQEPETASGIFGSPGWVLASLGGEDLGDEPLVTIRFDASQFAGTAGCIGYLGVLESEPDGTITRVSVTPDTAACGDDSTDEQLTAYLAALGKARQYRTSGDALEMLDADGEVLIVYRPAVTDHELEGTSWTLATLHGDENIPGTLVTAEFSDGYVLGSSGCNEYGSPYIIPEPGVIGLPSAVMTAMACEEPEGVMDQEIAFHDARRNVRGYELNDDSLELLDADGMVLMTFERSR